VNYPIWDVPASGLLIAVVAIVHVFVSHFAVGGGLFLVLAEQKARRDSDAALLGFVRRLSRFFILLTLVFGALTGVGIWFTIGLVHPAATSTLINTFVWGWAIEWTFFAAEIAAAMVYYYGWDRLSPRTHLAVGWIYFAAAWLSLVIINGILSFMLTPGGWVTTRGVWDGFFNPTYWPSLVARTFVAIGLAGLYALFIAAWTRDAEIKAKVARYAGMGWVLPMAIALPLALVWFLTAAAAAGAPVQEVFGATSDQVGELLTAVVAGSDSGQPIAQRATLVALVASVLAAIVTVFFVLLRAQRYGRPTTVLLMLLGLAAFGGAEFVREDLRKPFVIGQHMFVNGARLPAADAVPAPPPGAGLPADDPLSIDSLNRNGVLATALWAGKADDPLTQGRELFRLQCRACHTENGYLAIRPLVLGMSPAAAGGLLSRLASPVDAAGQPTAWNDANLRLTTWRGRRMPPFVGTPDERRALALYLAVLGGAPAEAAREAGAGEQYFEENCAVCHGPDGDFQIGGRGRTVEALYDMLDRLPEINEMMPPFEGSDQLRRALAGHLAALRAPAKEGGQ
jgi:mono/diheme cytochrome c family protein